MAVTEGQVAGNPKEATELIAVLTRDNDRLRRHIAALLLQLKGQPVEHPQQSAEREAACAAITD